MRQLTKAEACRELAVSLSTLDRRIALGEIEVRREKHGRRHRVYVVMENEAFEADSFDDGLTDIGSGGSHLAVARERIRGLVAQVTLLEDQLRWERERNVEVFDQLKKNMLIALEKKRKLVWWHFWKNGRSA